eukprot:SAG11_NODE_371_length_10051_cov_5.987741_9_plen_112_part_00
MHACGWVQHVHDLMPLRDITINLTHTVNHLSFGVEYPGQPPPTRANDTRPHPSSSCCRRPRPFGVATGRLEMAASSERRQDRPTRRATAAADRRGLHVPVRRQRIALPQTP